MEKMIITTIITSTLITLLILGINKALLHYKVIDVKEESICLNVGGSDILINHRELLKTTFCTTNGVIYLRKRTKTYHDGFIRVTYKLEGGEYFDYSIDENC
jgi:hypothetical protein